jgi:hypothetical protein
VLGIDFKCLGVVRDAFAESFHFGIDDTSCIIIVCVVVIYVDEFVAFFEGFIVSPIFEERADEHEAQFGALWVSFDGGVAFFRLVISELHNIPYYWCRDFLRFANLWIILMA